jgi:hypothetical protein
MVKKMVAIVAIMVFVANVFFAQIVAAKEPVYLDSVNVTKQFDYINISRPDTYETVFKKRFVISGYTEEENLKISIYIWDSKIKKYIPFENEDGNSSWKIGKSGIFMQEFLLPYKGANKLVIIATKPSELDNPQIKEFTITLLDDGIKNKLKNIVDGVQSLIKSNIFTTVPSSTPTIVTPTATPTKETSTKETSTKETSTKETSTKETSTKDN